MAIADNYQTMNLRPYQTEAALWLCQQHRALVKAPAGSGKTVIAAAALAMVQRQRSVVTGRRPVFGWLANTIEQCQQADQACKAFGVAPVIACAASALNWAPAEILIVDELQHATAPSWLAQIRTCAGNWWGFTATPETGNQERDALLASLFPAQFAISRHDIPNILTPATVFWQRDSDEGLAPIISAEITRLQGLWGRWWKKSSGELMAACVWRACVALGIVGNKRRTEAAIWAARRHVADKDAVLVLVNEVDHGKEIAEAIGHAVLVHSKMGRQARHTALENFRAQELPCVVATSLADEGTDLPAANVLVLVSGGKSYVKAVQRTGRVLRRFPGKDFATIYDFTDEWHQVAANHAKRRRAIYSQLGYSQLP